jgi:hypothetical protein
MFSDLVGRTVSKEFYVSGKCGVKRYYRGKIVGFKKALDLCGKPTNTTKFRVRYQDGDEEDLLIDEIRELLLRAKQPSTKDQIFSDLAERAHCWYFTHANTGDSLHHVKYALDQVRYGSYYIDPEKSLIQGFVYNTGVVSRNKMRGLLEHAHWKPICGQLHHDALYSEMFSKGVLVEVGHPPVQRPTLSEYTTAVETLEGPWWM